MKLQNAKLEEHVWDVIVAGGGLAGVTAAVAAARQGADVLLLEQYGYLGGMATTASVNPFMAYCAKYGEGEKFDWAQIANAGIFLSIIEALKKLGGLHSNRITFHPEVLKLVLDRLVQQAGVQVLFHCFLAEDEVSDDRIQSVTVVSKGGVFRLKARVFVDATGDADLAAFSGCPYTVGDEEGLCQPMTLCFDMGNVDTSVYAPVWGWYDGSYPGDSASCEKTVNEAFRRKKEMGEIDIQSEGISTYASCIPGAIHFNTTHVCGVTPMDVCATSRAEITAREQMWQVVELMKQSAPGFEKACLLSSGVQIGARESRRIVGDVVLNEQDILTCRKFEDSIARGTYSIDIHSVRAGKEDGGMREIPYNDYYTIPYRALLPQGVKNLIVAGRPLSSTHLAHGAHRVMPICASVGEGAGTAAALALQAGCDFRNVQVAQIQALLRQYGALY